MTSTTTARYRAIITIIAPAVMMVSFIYHPHVGSPTDADFVAKIAAAVNADTTRWGAAHLMTGIGSGLLMLAFIAVRSYLHEAGEERWSIIGLPLVILGSTLYALLPAMEFAPLAAAEAGLEIQTIEAVQGELYPWFIPILFTGAFFFAAGTLGIAIGILRSGILNSQLNWLITGSLIVMAFARFVPLSAVQFYVQGIAGIVALWPMAYVMWKNVEVRTAKESRPVPAI